MKKSELKPVYVDACIRARTKPAGSEEAVWYSQLGDGDIRDLKAAIDAHFEKSQWMPKESELKPLIEQARRARCSASTGRTTYARFECPDCGIVTGGFIEALDFRVRRCRGIPKDRATGSRICGGRMDEIFRQDNFETGNRSVADVPVREAVA